MQIVRFPFDFDLAHVRGDGAHGAEDANLAGRGRERLASLAGSGGLHVRDSVEGDRCSTGVVSSELTAMVNIN
jgi:hypothetical protein